VYPLTMLVVQSSYMYIPNTKQTE